jgi:4-hydroxy-2-oxoheptanedioate aldolase
MMFAEKLKKGEAVYGPFMKSLDAAFVESAGYAGFDFVILDMEHGPASFADLQNLIRGAEAAGIVPIVRTSDASEIAIDRALDVGAMGVQVPQIQSAEEAAKVVKAAKFFPLGERGVCRFVRAANYSSMPRDEYFKTANETLVIIQLEGIKAINDLDRILQVKGIDIIFIGPYDLSQSLKLPGQVNHPAVVSTMENIVKQAKEAGILVGTFTDTPEAAALWKKAGVQYLSYSVDVGIFTDACKQLVYQLHH